MSVHGSQRYYWLKMNQDFFDDDAMLWLEEQPNGEKYELFYLKLCLKSLKNDGIIIRKVGKMLMPYDVQGLAKLTNTSPDTVVVALELLKKIGLVEIQDSGALYLEQVTSMVGSETNDARRKREERAKQRALELSEKSGQCPPNVQKMSQEISARDRVRVRDRERVVESVNAQTSLSESKTRSENAQKPLETHKKHNAYKGIGKHLNDAQKGTETALKPKPTMEEVQSYISANELDKVEMPYFYDYWDARPEGFPLNWKQKAQSWQRNQRGSTETGQEKTERQDREVIAVGKEVDENGVWQGYVDF